ncbi:DUF5776 domain-containing protein [Enterococcus hirae]|uniref:DUF5776 domain-containing protein n=1 Tax=Enterococcus hirae TaxID=1354 RepID=UPI002E9CBAB3|nr:glycosyl hydrolase family 25 [Enterococcus hirae]
MKRIFSGVLLCTLLLNSTISNTYAIENIVKTSQSSQEQKAMNEVKTEEKQTNDSSDSATLTTTNDTKQSDSSTTTETSTSETSSTESSMTSSSTIPTQESTSTSGSETANSTSDSTQDQTDANQVDPREDAELGKRGTNHKKGTYAMQPSGNQYGIMSRTLHPDNVYADNPNLPRKDFIDVASWNGTISVAEYQKIKSYGVTGVTVKLTEGTSYTNPYAQSQINNAKAAGLSVSAYHYSVYTSVQTAQAEAKYFAQAASKLGLPKNTIMFDDAEDPHLISEGRDTQKNALAFNQQLKNLGYSNAALYLSRGWLDSGYINPAPFNKERIWVAQYPYTPTQSMQWNNDYGAWQWSSQMFFPGLANYQSRPFDMSMIYSSFFGTPNTGTGPDLSNYYTTNPERVILKHDDRFYNDVNFTSPGMNIKKNTLVTVKSIQTTASGIPRLFTDHGYLTANKSYVVAAQSNIDSYFTTNPKKVRLKSDDYFYADTAFTQRLDKVSKGTIVDVEDLAYTDSGVFRLRTKYGYLTANKSLVEEYQDYSQQYYTVNPKQVIVKVNDRFYKDVEFNIPSGSIPVGTVLKVIGIEEATNGVPRLKTSEGYVTANKNYVVGTISSIANYYTKNPLKVILKTDDYYYKDLNFTQRNEPLAKDKVVDVEKVEYTNEGIPRLKTAKGYLTANRSYTQQVTSLIDNYYYSNPSKIAMKMNDYFYKDVDFKQKSEEVSKNTIIDVLGITFSEDGFPRLKTAKGYVTANKNYVVQVTKAIEKYFIENPHKITMLVEDRYYSDLEFLYPGKPITKGMSVDVMDIEYSLDGVPRFKTKDGYLTANKSYITAAGNVNNNYFVTSPQKVKFLTNDFYYKDIDFKQRGNAIKSGSILEVEGIEYTLNGVPRLKIAGGYITANKWYVEKIK